MTCAAEPEALPGVSQVEMKYMHRAVGIMILDAPHRRVREHK